MAVKLLINSLFRGGAEKQFAELSAHIPYDSMLLLENEIAQKVDRARLTVLSSHTPAVPSVLKTAFIPVYAKKLAAAVKPGDTVLSFMERANLVNILAARQSGHRAVVCERTLPSGEFSGLRGMLMGRLIRDLYPHADVITANSQGVKRDLADIFHVPAEKIKIINNGYDTAEIAGKAAQPLNEGYDAVFKKPVIITGGRLTGAKGQWHLLRSFRKIKQTNRDAVLVILGEGSLKTYLTHLSVELGLKTFSGPVVPPPDADVYFAGFRENPYSFISRARVFVFTSIWEGFPNALVEAMACGVPVISADCSSGPREILSPETPFHFRTLKPEPAPYGVLMPVFSGLRRKASTPLEPAEEIWAETISAMLTDRDALDKYSRAGVKRAGEFELSRTAVLWRELLGV